MTNQWTVRLLGSVADRGRDLLGLGSDPNGADDLGMPCMDLLRVRGEASGVARARGILKGYESLDREVRQEFFNAQRGLRGIAFGNFLVKQVLEEVKLGLPGLRRFATLSPIPKFADSICSAVRGERDDTTREQLASSLREWASDIRVASDTTSLVNRLLAVADGRTWRRLPEFVGSALPRLTLVHL